MTDNVKKALENIREQVAACRRYNCQGAKELSPQEFLSIVLGSGIKFDATTERITIPYTEIRQLTKALSTAHHIPQTAGRE
jgi:DNA repair protein RadC